MCAGEVWEKQEGCMGISRRARKKKKEQLEEEEEGEEVLRLNM